MPKHVELRLRLPKELHAEYAQDAREAGRPLNAEVLDWLRQRSRKHEKFGGEAQANFFLGLANLKMAIERLHGSSAHKDAKVREAIAAIWRPALERFLATDIGTKEVADVSAHAAILKAAADGNEKEALD